MDSLLNLFQNTGHFALYYLLPFIVVLGIMIFFHELGHFLVAKFFDVKVLKFALGFGPKILSKDMGETEYSIRYIPLGGFVKMLGENEDNKDVEELPEEEKERSFSNKHPLKRMAIAAAGPLFNLILAFLLYWGLFYFAGATVQSPMIGEVVPDSPAERAGLLKGDIIRAIDGKAIEDFFEIQEAVFDKAGISVEVTVEREGQLMVFIVTPEEAIHEAFGQKIKMARIGVMSSGEYEIKEFDTWGAMKRAASETWTWIVRVCRSIVKLLTGAYSIKMLGGPITIAQMTGEAAQISLLALISFMAIISVNLGILNLFPVPILDGGLIVFLILELVLGKPLSVKKQELAQKVGLSMLLLLFAVVIYNEILRLIQ
jgi:regulator of sigma E protease